MRKIVLGVLLLVLVAGLAFGQDTPAKERKILVSLNPLGPLVGLVTGSAEFAVGQDLSVFVAPTYWNVHLSLLAGLVPDEFRAWSLSVAGGVNFFPLAPASPKGFFVGAGAGLGYVYVGTSSANVSGFLIDPFGQLGYRWIWGWFSMAPSFSLGYEIVLLDASVLGPGYDLFLPGGLSWSIGLGLAIAL